jgi:hypothetical protein
LLDAQIGICKIEGWSRAESFALHNTPTPHSLGRATAYAVLVLCTLGVAGWFLIGETPAAQRVVETIKPYDPLQ